MVRLNKIYTKTGDSGETGLSDGSRVAKTSARIAAIGAVDETNSAIGIARLDAEGDLDAMLGRIQNDLFDLGADLSLPEGGLSVEPLRIVAPQVERLERVRGRRRLVRVAPGRLFCAPFLHGFDWSGRGLERRHGFKQVTNVAVQYLRCR